MNSTTKRFPRTLQAAFGPYTSNVIEEPTQPRLCLFRFLWDLLRGRA